jgi:cob(I)alamin adenosyltransferase
MPRLTRIYTRGGDAGTTSLGVHQRVAKNHPRIAAFGDVDELNSHLGVVRAAARSPEILEALKRIQNDLFHLGSDLCVPEDQKKEHPVAAVEPHQVEQLEQWIDAWLRRLPVLDNFILPGGSPAAAAIHLARAVCRRAERQVTTLAAEEPIGPSVLPYLNRLSDLLFVMARLENKHAGQDETLWDSRA